ncbi:AraC family transcriptional regulator [Actinomadura harenae]|uniref:AraC family transcriptional regulator n=2 Tax=Actinomadura harenae TaxID=2483351 RepID=A0A3M2LIW9_9ACTN|nr:AraC family transcriptional regulator [Actinomadura harenae]
MHAHFERHVYHRHSHEAYSFGVTEAGAQAFRCRGGAHTSAAGMVMAFNPDDPHDGQAADALGFTYRIVHLGPELVGDVLVDARITGGAPLFASPVVTDPVLAASLRDLHAGLLGHASALRRDELTTRAVTALARRAARLSEPGRQLDGVVARAREILHDDPLADVTADDLAKAAGSSRFALYRAFRRAYGMAPSDYQRQLRLREARRLLRAGTSPADAAARTGFADQSHLHRWFVRYYGLTPGKYASGAQ